MHLALLNFMHSLQGPFKGNIEDIYIYRKLNTNNKFEHVSDFSLYGRWEALIVGRPLTISTPGKPNSEKGFVVILFKIIAF